MGTPKKIWDEEAVNLLRELLAEGKSFVLIGKEMGVSRASAIGKAHRLGIRGHKPTETLRVKAATPAPEIVEPMVVDHRCSILSLTNKTCRFPLWEMDTSQKFYCGAPGADFDARVPYCRQHSVVASSVRQSS